MEHHWIVVSAFVLYLMQGGLPDLVLSNLENGFCNLKFVFILCSCKMSFRAWALTHIRGKTNVQLQKSQDQSNDGS